MLLCAFRLLDLLENHGMSRGMAKLDTLVFDEADQLLEMGFRPAIEQILRNLPGKVRRRAFIAARRLCYYMTKCMLAPLSRHGDKTLRVRIG